MTDSDGSSSVRIFECPSPGDCDFTAGGSAKFLEHVNSEHPGEYQRDDWPDTDAARDEEEQDDSDE